jgi:hypothetical protein
VLNRRLADAAKKLFVGWFAFEIPDACLNAHNVPLSLGWY